jgi:hypothetical protein
MQIMRKNMDLRGKLQNIRIRNPIPLLQKLQKKHIPRNNRENRIKQAPRALATHKGTQASPTHTETRVSTPWARPTASGDWERQARPSENPRSIHPRPINPVFYGSPCPPSRAERPPLFGAGFPLRCFQRLSLAAWLPGICPAGQPVD